MFVGVCVGGAKLRKWQIKKKKNRQNRIDLGGLLASTKEAEFISELAFVQIKGRRQNKRMAPLSTVLRSESC